MEKQSGFQQERDKKVRRLIPAIAIVGAPLSGKSTVLRNYRGNLVSIGDYAHSLPIGSGLRKECEQYWAESKPFDAPLLDSILDSYDISSMEWALLDGTPRSRDQVPIVEKFFSLKSFVELRVNESIWNHRAMKAMEERKEREDSKLPQLIKRKEVFERSMDLMRGCYPWRVVDNSGPLSYATNQLEVILSSLIDEMGGSKKYA